ncbi:MAG: HAD family hydrolase [Thermoplasmata archaeon]|nr:HAD family hydrolase [Thermoplasmata archaeon]
MDRDGTLNPDLHYLKDAERLEVFRGVGDGIRWLRQHGYLVICVTNQSGIERGFYTAEDVHRIHRRLNEILRPRGAAVDAFYYCPHAPGSACACRKPGVRLFREAAEEWGIELSASALVGDRALDIEAGVRLGLLTAAVPHPGGSSALMRELAESRVTADLWAPTFAGAAARILTRG